MNGSRRKMAPIATSSVNEKHMKLFVGFSKDRNVMLITDVIEGALQLLPCSRESEVNPSGNVVVLIHAAQQALVI